MVSGNAAGDGLRRAPPGSGAMARLRDRMIKELRSRGMAERTIGAYVDDMRLMTERTGLLPGRVTEQDIKAYLQALREVRGPGGLTSGAVPAAAHPTTWRRNRPKRSTITADCFASFVLPSYRS
jgi:hypothetical protein